VVFPGWETEVGLNDGWEFRVEEFKPFETGSWGWWCEWWYAGPCGFHTVWIDNSKVLGGSWFIIKWGGSGLLTLTINHLLLEIKKHKRESVETA
jgi:hypothetical protein